MSICCNGWSHRLVQGGKSGGAPRLRAACPEGWLFRGGGAYAWRLGMIWSVRKEGQGPSSGVCHPQKFGNRSAVNRFLLSQGQPQAVKESFQSQSTFWHHFCCLQDACVGFACNSQFSSSQNSKKRNIGKDKGDEKKSFTLQNSLSVLRKPPDLHVVQPLSPRCITVVQLLPWRGKTSRSFLCII